MPILVSWEQSNGKGPNQGNRGAKNFSVINLHNARELSGCLAEGNILWFFYKPAFIQEMRLHRQSIFVDCLSIGKQISDVPLLCYRKTETVYFLPSTSRAQIFRWRQIRVLCTWLFENLVTRKTPTLVASNH